MQVRVWFGASLIGLSTVLSTVNTPFNSPASSSAEDTVRDMSILMPAGQASQHAMRSDSAHKQCRTGGVS